MQIILKRMYQTSIKMSRAVERQKKIQGREDIILIGERMQPSEDTIFVCNHLDPFQPVQDQNKKHEARVHETETPGLLFIIR